MVSQKTIVIERLFDNKISQLPQTAADLVVTFDEIAEAIRETGVDLRTNNVANFWKDLTRNGTLEKNWPARVLSAGYFGEDAIGSVERASFRFVAVEPGFSALEQRFAFELDRVSAAGIQSLSMPRSTKALARTDENWLVQVAAQLRVVETHFALFSKRDVVEVTFLQTNVKMSRAESDATYVVTESSGSRWLVSVEAKRRREQLHGPQIARAAHSLFTTYGNEVGVQGTIPFGLKIVGPSLLHTIEFDPVSSPEQSLVVASEGAITLTPAVQGIS